MNLDNFDSIETKYEDGQLPVLADFHTVRDESIQSQVASLVWRGCTVTYMGGNLHSVTCDFETGNPDKTRVYKTVANPTEADVIQLFKWTFVREFFRTPSDLIQEPTSILKFMGES